MPLLLKWLLLCKDPGRVHVESVGRATVARRILLHAANSDLIHVERSSTTPDTRGAVPLTHRDRYLAEALTAAAVPFFRLVLPCRCSGSVTADNGHGSNYEAGPAQHGLGGDVSAKAPTPAPGSASLFNSVCQRHHLDLIRPVKAYAASATSQIPRLLPNRSNGQASALKVQRIREDCSGRPAGGALSKSIDEPVTIGTNARAA